MQKIKDIFKRREAVLFLALIILMAALWALKTRREAANPGSANTVVTAQPVPSMSTKATPPPKEFAYNRTTSGTRTVKAPVATPTPTPYIAQSTPAPTPVPTPPGPPVRIAFFDAPVRPKASPTPVAAPTPRRSYEDDEVADLAQATPVPVRRVSDTFAPFGSMLKCETVFTVDSSNAETPVVGLVTEDLWQNGKLVIPAGTKVHGTASASNLVPNRLPTGERWVLVFPSDHYGERINGSELTIKAMALDRAEKGADSRHWSVEDGAYGLKGYTIDSNNINRIRKFLATFISAGAAGLQTTQQQTGLVGTSSVVTTTPRNAALGGLTAVMADEAGEIQREIEAHGSYTRVPGGTTFYLYCEQTVDAKDARVGDSQAYITGAPSQLRDQGNSPSTRSFLAQQTGQAPRARTGTADGSSYGQTSFAPQYPNGSSSTVPYYASPGRTGYTYRYSEGVVPNAPATATTPDGSTGGDLPVQ